VIQKKTPLVIRSQQGFAIIEGLLAAGLLGIIVAGGISVYGMLNRTRTTSIQTEQIKSFLNWRASYLEGAQGCITFLDQIGVSQVPLGNSKSLSEVRVKVDGNPFTLFKVGQSELNGNLVVNKIELSDLTGDDPADPKKQIPLGSDEDIRWTTGMRRAYLRLSIYYTGFKREGVKTNVMVVMTNYTNGQIIGCADYFSQMQRELKSGACENMGQGFYWNDIDPSKPSCLWEDPQGLNLNTELRKQVCNYMNYELDVTNDANKCTPP